MKNQNQFKHVIVAIDVAIFTLEDSKLKVALIKVKSKPFENYWTLPGGMVATDESIDEAVVRHTKEKAGIKKIHLEQLFTFGEVDRDPRGRVVSTGYLALSPVNKLKLKTSDAYAAIELFDISNLPLKIAYDHKEIIKTAIKRLRSKLVYTNIIKHLMTDEITLSELQDVYELILKRKFDKRNFRKKITDIKLVKPTKRKSSGGAHRPATLYKFSEEDDAKINFI